MPQRSYIRCGLKLKLAVNFTTEEIDESTFLEPADARVLGTGRENSPVDDAQLAESRSATRNRRPSNLSISSRPKLNPSSCDFDRCVWHSVPTVHCRRFHRGNKAHRGSRRAEASDAAVSAVGRPSSGKKEERTGESPLSWCPDSQLHCHVPDRIRVGDGATRVRRPRAKI